LLVWETIINSDTPENDIDNLSAKSAKKTVGALIGWQHLSKTELTSSKLVENPKSATYLSGPVYKEILHDYLKATRGNYVEKYVSDLSTAEKKKELYLKAQSGESSLLNTMCY